MAFRWDPFLGRDPPLAIVYRIWLTGPAPADWLPAYIGMSIGSLRNRLESHQQNIPKRQTRLYRAWRISGAQNFKARVMFSGSFEDCVQMERSLIARARLQAKLQGFRGCLNVMDGGEHPGLPAPPILLQQARKPGQKKIRHRAYEAKQIDQFGIVRHVVMRSWRVSKKQGWKTEEVRDPVKARQELKKFGRPR